ncbi:MAG: pyruvate kinase [Proteobacteria bacterium]|nr:pyruvate kinase [Pseudomonadota bacterium]
MRQTKIVASLGPATDDPLVLAKMFRRGVDVVRINFSHGDVAEHQARVGLVRKTALEVGKTVAILGDLQGPKIRLERFKQHKVELVSGNEFFLDGALGKNDGDEVEVGLTYKALADDVKRGDILMLDDGNIVLKVSDAQGQRIRTRVLVGGKLSDNKGINLQGGGLSAGSLTDKDKQDIKLAARLDIDFLAVSFVRSAADVEEARTLYQAEGKIASIVSKVERKEAIDNILEITRASDVVMIARGDLGVEIGDANLPGVQKRIIKLARENNRVVITATQMMQSMIDSPIPTRAEVSDVANAVMDGSDAVMLSAETAVGRHPAKVIGAMARICKAAEIEIDREKRFNPGVEFGNAEESIAMASMYTANHFPVVAILALTESGRTALLMSRANAKIPIYAMTRNSPSARRMCIYRGVMPVEFDFTQLAASGINRAAVEWLNNAGLVEEGEQVIITRGDTSAEGGTNTMKIVRVGKVALQ